MMWPNGEVSLGLSMPVNSHTAPKPPEQRERRGQKQTTHSKRMVRNGAWWLQRIFGKDRLAFLTLTLPDEAVTALESKEDASDLYAEMTRQYLQWMRRRLSRAGLCEEIVGCDEVQPERFRTHGKVALHTHLVFQGRQHRKGAWAIGVKEFLNRWNSIVSNVLGIEIESSSSTRVEKLRKSAEYYLAKYMSKAGSVVEEVIAAGKRYMLPAHWWHCSSKLKKAIKDLCVEISDEAAEVLYSNREELKVEGILQWFYVHEIEFIQSHGEPVKRPVAFCAKFKKPEYREMFMY